VFTPKSLLFALENGPALAPTSPLRYGRAMSLRVSGALLALLFSSLPVHAGKNIVEGGLGFDAAFNDVGPLPDTTTAEGRNKPLSSLTGPPSHGILFVRYKRIGLFRPNVGLGLEFNTDTLAADLSAWNVGLPGLSVGTFARAEALLAGVNINWMQDGLNKTERGFGASYGLVGGRVAYTVLQRLSFEFEASARGWFFNRMPGSAANLRVPKPFAAAEPRARIKWEGLTPDGHRLGLYTGLRGMLEIGADVRTNREGFGGFTDGKVESRNSDASTSLVPQRLSAQGFAGFRFFRMVWFQAVGNLGYGIHEDDITRTRVGGQNPYTVTMPGAAWGEFVCDRYAATSLYLGVRPMPLLYAGAGIHGAVVNDPGRVGHTDELGILRGISGELRMGFFGWGVLRLQVGGNADVKRPHGRGAMGAFLWLEIGNPV
jgi:hypothetical protein